MKLAKTLAVVAGVCAAAAITACSGTTEIRYIQLDDAGLPTFPGKPGKGSGTGSGSDSNGSTNPTPPAPTGTNPAKPPPPPDPNGFGEEKTVGQLCNTDADCEVAGSVGDNVCSVGFFSIGDLFTDPVCVSQCVRGPGQTFTDILCDGDANGAPGVCTASNPGEAGVCFPSCEFSSTTIDTPCAGGNKCTAAYFGTAQSGEVFSLGMCLGACSSDADCAGATPGSKCQKEIGLCANANQYVTYTKQVGQACNEMLAPNECSCNTVGGGGPNAARGFCSHACVTGAAGDALCGSKVAGWKCSAGLPTQFGGGGAAFTAQPAGILGGCAKPCASDGDCAALAATVNVGGGTAVGKCESVAGGNICVLQ
jgi:hypothetical protein